MVRKASRGPAPSGRRATPGSVRPHGTAAARTHRPAGLRTSGSGTMTWGRDTDEHEAAEQLRDVRRRRWHAARHRRVATPTGPPRSSSGRLLGGTVRRDDVVLCTKAGVRRTRVGGGVVDASRGALLDALDASLVRLGTDHVDLWLVQTPDPRTPLDETLSALRLAVASGRARYVGPVQPPGLADRARGDAARARRRGSPPSRWSTPCCSAASSARCCPRRPSSGSGCSRGRRWGAACSPASTGAPSRRTPGRRRRTWRASSSRTSVRARSRSSRRSRRPPRVWAAPRWRSRSPGCGDAGSIASAIVGARTAAQLRGSLAAAATSSCRRRSSLALDEVSAPEIGYPERR